MQIHHPILPSRSQRQLHKVVVRASGLHKYSTALGERKLSAKSANSGNSANVNSGIRVKKCPVNQLILPGIPA
jgi:hypothetical protein